MHMADALVSPAVGGTMWAVSAGLIGFCARQVRKTLRDNLVPMMGVLGAFVFAAQMINFSIPLTGSSGHLGGGLLLAILLGPYAAFLVMASVLTVQALFFADGGLLALGCNIFNLGFLPAFIAYPCWRVLSGGQYATARAWGASILAAVAAIQIGAIGVVLQTSASGITDLPFRTFLLLMLPIHLAIGVVEGLATAAVVTFVAQARPDALPTAHAAPAPGRLKPVLVGLGVAAVVLGGLGSWFASTHPDGLEWSIAHTAGVEELEHPAGGVHENLAALQARTAVLPDYGFREPPGEETGEEPAAAWPSASTGTSLSGILGGLLTLALALLIGLTLRALPRARSSDPVLERGG